jgi:hypothetical protein
MTNSVTVSFSGTPAVGAALTVSGTVSPAADVVSVCLSQQNTTLPTGPFFYALTTSGAYSTTLTPTAPGTYYAWAWDQATGAQAVSGAIVVPNPAVPALAAVPLAESAAAALLNGTAAGLTPDLLPAAAAPSGSDTFLVSQSGKNILAQTWTALWTWITGLLPSYLLPVKVITSSTALDTSDHNGRILQVTATGVTISVNTNSMSAGFNCTVINDSSGVVTFSGINVDSGGTTMAAGRVAEIYARLIGTTLTVTAKV